MMLRAALFTLVMTACAVVAQIGKPEKDLAEENRRFSDVLLEVRSLASAERYDQALARLGDAEKIKPGSPIVLNARGSIYTSMKDYGKARECFKQAETLNPGSFEPRFNLSELEYVQGSYEAAAASFTKLLTATPQLQAPIRSLVQFKIIVCHLKLAKTKEAEDLVKRFAFAEESPANYFTRMALAIHKGDNAAAADLFGKAQKVFDGGAMAPYVDALVEARWLSFKSSGETKN